MDIFNTPTPQTLQFVTFRDLMEVLNNGHDYVDLGLPSGLLWATCNVGASKQTDYGLYFQWGDIEGQDMTSAGDFNWSNYKYGSLSNITKYNSTDNLTELESTDDMVSMNYNSPFWRTPTTYDFQELMDNTEAAPGTYGKNGWTSIRGDNGLVHGILRKSKVNDNTIFFPCAGYSDDEGWVKSEGAKAYYWCNSCLPEDPTCGLAMYFTCDEYRLNTCTITTNSVVDRSYGCNVRGVLGFSGEESISKYVDMGEAGIWATCNVGANEPHEAGLYFAWAERDGYDSTSSRGGFDWSHYKYGDGANALYKYNFQSNRGRVDNLGNILSYDGDDGANENMGGILHMPSREDYKKLVDVCNSEFTWDYNGTGVPGRIFRLKTDSSKELFFPAVGYMDNNTMGGTNEGYYWTSWLKTDMCYYAYDFYFNSTKSNTDYYDSRYVGCPIRAMYKNDFIKTSLNGYSYVDLGLPSGNLWSPYNLNTSREDNAGDYYAWGETTTKSTFTTSNYKFTNDKKYSNSSLEYLELEDDVVHVRMGGGWQIPSPTDFQEILDNCDWKSDSVGGYSGLRFTSRINGKSIFFGFFGCYIDSLNNSTIGWYWSNKRETFYSTTRGLPMNIQNSEYNTMFTFGYQECSRYGCTIRPVCKISR